MGKYTNWIPQPIRTKLWPYKAKLLGIPTAIENSPVESEPIQNVALREEMQTFSRKYGTTYIPSMLAYGWTKPGSMFDELGHIFQENRKLFVLGNSDDIARVRRKLNFLETPIESETIPLEDLLNDINRLKQIAEKTGNGYTTLIAYPAVNQAASVAQMLISYGNHYLNVNLFWEIDFLGIAGQTGDYASVFAIYTEGKVYLKHQNMLVTTICNLNCEYCLNYNPYNHHQKHFSLEELKHCADIYFSHIDRVGFFELTGGEPLLYPQLREIIFYIAKKYRNKINDFVFVTNGSIIPSDEFCEFLKEHNVVMIVDDYTAAIPKLEANLIELRNKLNRTGTDCIFYPKVREFLKSFPPVRKNFDLSEKELQEKYRACMIGVQNLRDGKLCSCTYLAFATNAELIPDSPEDWFDMDTMSGSLEDKKKLIEFRTGFNRRGYTAWCRYCNGVQTINKHYAPAAEQVKGRLNWDIENPTFLD